MELGKGMDSANQTLNHKLRLERIPKLFPAKIRFIKQGDGIILNSAVDTYTILISVQLIHIVPSLFYKRCSEICFVT